MPSLTTLTATSALSHAERADDPRHVPHTAPPTAGHQPIRRAARLIAGVAIFVIGTVLIGSVAWTLIGVDGRARIADATARA